MTNNKFEKQIADKLNQYEVQPGEGLLDSIFEKRASKKKPFVGAGLFMASAIIIATISVLYISNGRDHEVKLVSNSQTAAESPKTGIRELPERIENKRADQVQPGGHGNTEALASSPVKTGKRDAVVKRPATKLGHIDNINASVNSGTSEKGTSNLEPGSQENNVRNTSLANHAFEGDNGQNITQRYFDINSKNRPSIARMQHKGNSHLYVYHSVSEKVVDANSSISFMSMNPLRKFEATYDLGNESPLTCYKVERTSATITGRKPLFIDMLFAPSLTMSSASGNASVENYANSIRKNAYNAQYGVRVSVPVCGRFSVFSGLFYQEQSSVFNGSIVKSEQVTRTIPVVTYINDPVQGTIKVTTYRQVTGMEDKKTDYNFTNTYKIVQLPLGLSYNFGYRKFDFAVNTSALVNMVTGSNGRSLDIANNNTSGFSSSGKYFNMGAGLSLMSALKVSPRFKLILEPGVQYFKINSIKAGNNINEKVFNSHLTLGLRYSVF